MVYAIIGGNCSGKSTPAAAPARRTGAEIITGRDCLRMTGSEAEAASLFRAGPARAEALCENPMQRP